MRAIESDRDEITAAVRQVVADNPWYTVDQFASQVHGRYRHNMRLRYDYVLSRIGPLDGKTVIDVGCGDGQWSALLCSRFAVKLIGIDYNELRLDRYRRRLPAAEALLGTCAKIPVESGAADLVMCHQVLEHLGDPAAALIEARRVLKPNGMLLVSVPNEGTWLKQHVQYRWIEPNALRRSDHVQFFTGASLERLLAENGFSVDRVDSVGFHFPHNGISRRLLSYQWSFRTGVLLGAVFPVLRDCLFAWAKPGEPT